MPWKPFPANVRIVVKVTKPERDALVARCEEEVRTVGSWFRLQIQRAWRARKPPRRVQEYRRKQGDGVSRTIDVWARVTDDERDQLEVLTADEGVSVSGWFRKRLEAELGASTLSPRGRRFGTVR